LLPQGAIFLLPKLSVATGLTFFWWAKESYKEKPTPGQNLKINYQFVH